MARWIEYLGEWLLKAYAIWRGSPWNKAAVLLVLAGTGTLTGIWTDVLAAAIRKYDPSFQISATPLWVGFALITLGIVVLILGRILPNKETLDGPVLNVSIIYPPEQTATILKVRDRTEDVKARLAEIAAISPDIDQHRVGRDLLVIHDFQTRRAREVPVIFKLSNNGQTSAERIKIVLSFDGNVPIEASRAACRATTISADLNDQLRLKLVQRIHGDWYSPAKSGLDDVPRGVLQDASRLFQDAHDKRKFFVNLKELRHAHQIIVGPILVDFGYHADENVHIRWEVHAVNLPKPCSGSVLLRVQSR